MKYLHCTLILILLFSRGLLAQTCQEYDSIGTHYYNSGDLPRAIENKVQSFDLCVKKNGINNESCISILNEIGYYKATNGEYDTALVILNSARERIVEIYGADSRLFADNSSALGDFYMKNKDYSKAPKYYMVARDLYKDKLGVQSEQYLTALYSVGSCYVQTGEFDKALQVLSDLENLLSEDLTEDNKLLYAMTVNSLGILNRKTGQYDKALYYYEMALDLFREMGSKYKLYLPIMIKNLAVQHTRMNDFSKARELHDENRKLVEEIYGKDHPEYAMTLKNIAQQHTNLGRWERALPLYEEALQIIEKSYGVEHTEYAIVLSGIASCYHAFREYDKALKIYAQALEITENAVGKNHVLTSVRMHKIGIAHYNVGNYNESLSYLTKSLEIREQVSGENHPWCGFIKSRIGKVYALLKNYELAEQYQLEAIEIIEKSLGPDHFEIYTPLNQLGLVSYHKKDVESAFSYFERSKSAAINNINEKFSFSSEYGKIKLVSRLQSLFDVHATCAYDLYDEYPAFATLAFENELLLKGLVLDESRSVRLAIALSNDSTIVENYKAWKDLRKQIAIQLSKPISERLDYYDSLVTKADELEQWLVRMSSDFEKGIRAGHISSRMVQDQLGEKEACVEFISYNIIREKRTDSVMYAAIIIRPGLNNPYMVPLFEEKQMLELLQHQDFELPLDFYDRLYSSTHHRSDYLQSKKTLYDLIWRPIDEKLDGVEKVYYSSSGLLHRVNIEALPIGTDTILADKYVMEALQSSRQLVSDVADREYRKTQAVVYGGVEYKMDSMAVDWQVKEERDSLNKMPFSDIEGTDLAFVDTTLRSGDFRFLPHTLKEAESICNLMQAFSYDVKMYRGSAGTEESFYTLSQGDDSPAIIHLATHGYFFPDPVDTKIDDMGNVPAFVLSEHPMIRSGLMLAGSEYAWKKGTPAKQGIEDGILTAFEISQMDLSNTELVVLSACETGLGDIEGTEGVYGLQRAFKMAGAKYLMMSLWQVPDRSSSELMLLFYRNYLEKGMKVPSAFTEARKEMRRKYDNPYYWAGFVLVK